MTYFRNENQNSSLDEELSTKGELKNPASHPVALGIGSSPPAAQPTDPSILYTDGWILLEQYFMYFVIQRLFSFDGSSQQHFSPPSFWITPFSQHQSCLKLCDCQDVNTNCQMLCGRVTAVFELFGSVRRRLCLL